MKSLIFSTSLVAGIAALFLPFSAKAQDITKDEIIVTASRIETAGLESAVETISKEVIENSTATSIAEILSAELGIAFNDYYGGTNASYQTIDMRGYGEQAGQNTLILLDGVRLGDIDLAGVDLGAIPLDSIERIEVLRGNSGAVVYGGGIGGGVINIITRKSQKDGANGKVTLEAGSFDSKTAKFDFNTRRGALAFSAYGSIASADGYRDNNGLNNKNATMQISHNGATSLWRAKLDIIDQYIELPGARTINLNTGLNEAIDDPEGAATPNDYADKSEYTLLVGHEQSLVNGGLLILEAMARTKTQESLYDVNWQFVNTDIETFGVLPRYKHEFSVGGAKVNLLTGSDIYYVDYHSTSHYPNDLTYLAKNMNANQTNYAAYAQSNIDLADDFSVNLGVRLEGFAMQMGDTGNDAAASQASFEDSDNHYAWNLGAEKRFGSGFAIYGRAGHSFRIPNLDERAGTEFPADYELETQTSNEAEIGARGMAGAFSWTGGLFISQTKNEIRFNPQDLDPLEFGFNYNADLIRREGVELGGKWQVNKQLAFKANANYVDARYSEGAFSGKTVPLVPDLTASIVVSQSFSDQLRVDLTALYEAERKLGNDDAGNFDPIDDFVTLDAKLAGDYQGFGWALRVNNLFDETYYRYGTASATTAGLYNVYTLPGRHFMLTASRKF